MAIKPKKARRVDILLDEMRKQNFDPAVELIKMAKANNISAAERIRICQSLMTHVYPTMKAVELDTKSGQPVVFNFDIGKTTQSDRSTQNTEES